MRISDCSSDVCSSDLVAGLPLAAMFFRALDPEVHIQQPVEDGAQVAAGTTLMRLFGNARALLTAERSALNTIQHLTGIATMTRAYVDAIAGTRSEEHTSEIQSLMRILSAVFC